MPVGVLEHASHLLNDFQGIFHDLKEVYGNDATHVQDLKLQQFAHGSVQSPGIAATANIPKGETVVMMPERMVYAMPDNYSDEAAFAHLKDDYEKTAFWLAQKKVDLLDHPPSGELNPSDKILLSYIQNLPKLKDFKNQGLPLAASYQDVHKLEGLPHLGDLVKFTDKQRESLLASWADYSQARGTQPKFGYTDALWALAVVRNRGFVFPNIPGVYLTPVGDLPNFASKANAVVGVENDLVELQAAKDIKAGEEVTLSFSNGHPAPGIDLLAKHGFVEDAAKDSWSAQDCAVIQKRLTPDVTKDSKMLQAVSKLVDTNCAGAGEAQAAKETAETQAAAAKEADSAQEQAAAKETLPDKKAAGVASVDEPKVDDKIGKDSKAASQQMMDPMLAIAATHCPPRRSRKPLYSSFL
jgi:hypothetical protein